MKASVVIPNHRSEATLPRTLESVRAAAKGLNVEIVVSDDPTGRGLPWARNRGLERATGDVVFFVDADDTVEPDFFAHPLAAMAAADADFCIFQYALNPLKRDYDLTGNAAVRAALLPAYIGFSFEDVARWNAGGDLFANREPGSVCRCCFRREFLERYRLRFNERLFIYEDAPFMAECALCAERVVSLRENLYDYLPSATGITATVTGRARFWDYKFAIHAHRLVLDEKYGGVWSACAASPSFSALEFLRARRFGDLRRYLALPRTTESLRAFPRSPRHPLVALSLGLVNLVGKGTVPARFS